MAEPTSKPPAQAQSKATAKPAPKPEPDAGHIPITEEMDKAKWTLPPVGIIAIGVGIVLVAVVAIAFFGRAKPAGAGGITDAFAVNSSNGVLVSVQFTLRNSTEKPLYIKQIGLTLDTNGQTYTDEAAASSSDYERYLKAYPDMRPHVTQAVVPETRINPGQAVSGTAIFGFQNVTKENFDTRKALALNITPYDRPPFTLAENRQGGAAK
jgi:hypothetical protein